MTDAAGDDEEMEHGMHVFRFIEGIKHRTHNITDTLGDEPDDGSCRKLRHHEGRIVYDLCDGVKTI